MMGAPSKKTKLNKAFFIFFSETFACDGNFRDAVRVWMEVYKFDHFWIPSLYQQHGLREASPPRQLFSFLASFSSSRCPQATPATLFIFGFVFQFPLPAGSFASLPL
jgi:hypothetical protein